MKRILFIILSSIILFSGCQDNKSPSGESAEKKYEREDRERKEAMGEVLDNLKFSLDRLEKQFGIILNHHPKEKIKITVDLNGLFDRRFDSNELLEYPEGEITRTLRGYLNRIEFLTSSFYKKGGWVTPGHEGKEEFYKDLGIWPINSNIPETAEEWVAQTRNLYHSCINNANLEEYAIVYFIRSANQMDSTSCRTLFETFKNSTHLEITIPSGFKGIIKLVALRGIPLESLTLVAETEATVDLTGLEMAKDLKELTLKNIKVGNLNPISNLKEMDSLVIDFPNLKRHLKNCPTKGENETLRDFCQNLGF